MAKIKTSLFERESKNLKVLRNEAKECRNCDLWKNGTQTVFGEGVNDAKIMIVREQPGNQEDLQGKPFVGLAGGSNSSTILRKLPNSGYGKVEEMRLLAQFRLNCTVSG